MRVPAAVVVAMAAALLSLGGCKVTEGQPEAAPSNKVDEVLASGTGRFDLTRPPSRAEVGLPAGKADVTYQRQDHEPFEVQVVLPDGKQLTVEARLLTFDALSAPDPTTGPPTSMDVHYYAPDLDAGRDHLLVAAQAFGLDTGLIAKWYDEAKAPLPNQAPPRAESPWLRTNVGYLRMDVQARYLPADGTTGSDQTVIHYLLTWEAGSTSPTS
jgi:hypothetical protein